VAHGRDHDAQLAQAGFDVAADGYLVPMPIELVGQLGICEVGREP
jgi:hypothetical protein